MAQAQERATSSGRSHRDPCGVCLDCAVRRQAVCAALENHELGALQAIMISTRVGAQQTVVEEGQPRRRVFTLTSGMLRLYTMLPDGRRQITAFLLPGDYLGLGDESSYDQSAEAVVDSVLCGFPVAEMERLMERYPRLQLRLNQMTRIALRQARDSQLILGRLAPVEKLASFLLVLSARQAEHGQAESPVHLAMTRTDIADYLGLTIETVSRSFTKLRLQGLIQLPEAHQVEIVDRRALTAVAGITPR
ncbi:MAG TPA: helix-turn-helix domain-containing protein [Geminicoccus sp.]|uniref:helix-turn-helix domain-containing protein n=1 Tax=Geminicoccus sp. TaxID=2024832 RepID=UPI002CD4A614|nr:helix-turn-helix domain-containing protein [Geminicoccus sp.]HWL67835.1 helix-turn-helix domain-containing protein [Geminicoccus sp.]